MSLDIHSYLQIICIIWEDPVFNHAPVNLLLVLVAHETQTLLYKCSVRHAYIDDILRLSNPILF